MYEHDFAVNRFKTLKQKLSVLIKSSNTQPVTSQYKQCNQQKIHKSHDIKKPQQQNKIKSKKSNKNKESSHEMKQNRIQLNNQINCQKLTDKIKQSLVPKSLKCSKQNLQLSPTTMKQSQIKKTQKKGYKQYQQTKSIIFQKLPKHTRNTSDHMPKQNKLIRLADHKKTIQTYSHTNSKKQNFQIQSVGLKNLPSQFKQMNDDTNKKQISESKSNEVKLKLVSEIDLLINLKNQLLNNLQGKLGTEKCLQIAKRVDNSKAKNRGQIKAPNIYKIQVEGKKNKSKSKQKK